MNDNATTHRIVVLIKNMKYTIFEINHFPYQPVDFFQYKMLLHDGTFSA